MNTNLTAGGSGMKTPEPPPGYRLLRKCERIQRGDLFWDVRTKQWRSADLAIGASYKPTRNYPMGRLEEEP